MWFSLILLLTAGNFRTMLAATVEIKFGKANITESESDGFYCETVRFPTPFQSGGTIRVFPSLSHEDHPRNINEASVAIVDSVDKNYFSICLMEPAQPSGRMTLNWFAFSDGFLPKGILAGSVSYNAFTSGSVCTDINFSLAFNARPKIFLSVRHVGNTERKDVMTFWAEDVTERKFRVCLREMVSFSGTHKNLYIDWVGMENTFSQNMTDLDSIVFPNTDQPPANDNYAYCQVRNFSRRFYEPPVVLVSAHRKQNLLSYLMDQNIVAWIKDVGITAFEVCIKDLPGLIGNHEPITVDYSALGDLNPCLNVTCEKFAVCRAFGPYDARCVCVTDCPLVDEKLCASNGKTFNSVCLFQLEVCQTNANYTIYQRGSCRAFPMTKGRRDIDDIPNWSQSHCQTVEFDPLTFYPDKPVHVQISVSHVNDSGQVHEAAVSWVEDVSDSNFTFCVMESGRNEGPPHGLATVEYMAYQGTPKGALAGSVPIPEWWTGSKCQTVYISSGYFSSTPTVLVTAEHHRLSLTHDAASLWLEDVKKYSFKVCMRELQNFDGPHQDIHVNWIAFETLEKPIFTEQGSNHFARTSKNPLSSTNYANCKDVIFAANYTKPPTVLVSPKHSTSRNNVDPKNNGITTWIETITVASFRICFKELHSTNGYDPVTISHVVLGEICDSGWIYFGGYCYKRKSLCQTWKNASTTCIGYGSNLARIETAEEDVFVQNFHYGQPSWIGLNDQANEGIYLWSNGGPASYTRWDPQVSTPYSDTEDCVEISARDKKYHWQSSSCENCRGYTCMKDYDECAQNTNACDPNADCKNIDGSYKCQCRSGFSGNGQNCTDVNECHLDFCSPNANCINTVGTYTCRCKKGYSGNGLKCTDVDECSVDSMHSCDSNAHCYNNVGSYTCRCRSGYEGDGFTCLVSCGDPGRPHNGYARGSSYTEGSTVHFYCDRYNYRLSGASSARCQSSGAWSNPTPSCRYTYYGR